MRYLITLLMLLVLASPASAQLNLTYTAFQPGQTISSAQFTANFTAISSNALNRTGGIMTGTFTARAITASTSDTYDITGFRDLTLTRNASIGGTLGVTGVSTFTGNILTAQTDIRIGADVDVLGHYLSIGDATVSNAPSYFQAGEPGVSVGNTIVANNYYAISGGVSGRRNTATGGSFIRLGRNEMNLIGISDVGTSTSMLYLAPASAFLTATNIALLGHTNITGNLVTSGSIVSSSSGSFQSATVVSGTVPQMQLYQSDAAADGKYWMWVADGTTLNLTAYNDATSAGNTPFQVARSGIDITNIYLSGATITMSATTGHYGIFTAAENGGSPDNQYGIIGVTRLTTANNLSYYSLVRQGTLAYGIGVDASNQFIMGAASTGKLIPSPFFVGSTTAITLNTVTFTVAGNTVLNGNLTVTGSMSASLNMADGSDTAPGMKFTNDTNTGIYRPSTDVLAITAGGVASMTIDNTTSTYGSALVFILGNLNVRNILPNASGTYTIGTSGNLYSAVYAFSHPTTSDRRAKLDINPLELGIEFIDKLKPVNYRFVKEPGKLRYGFIAQDLLELGFAGVDTSDPNNYALNYDEFVAPMVKGMQEMHGEINSLLTILKIQEAKIDFLVERIKELERGYGKVRSVE